MIEQQAQIIIKSAKDLMDKVIRFLDNELSKIRAGKANPQIFEDITVDYYGAKTPLQQVASITVADSKTITIQPWEKNLIQPIEKAILSANIGITPQNDGSVIRIFIPPLTEERRKELVKKCYTEAEQAKITVRNARRDAVENLKKLKKDGLSEDIEKKLLEDIQKLTDQYVGLIDNTIIIKEKEIMIV